LAIFTAAFACYLANGRGTVSGDAMPNRYLPVAILRDRSFAEWIADNRITEMRVSGEMPSVEETAGEVDFAARKWHWVTKVSQTQVKGLRRIDVSVRRDSDPEGSSIATLAGFIGKTASASPQSVVDWYRDDGSGGPAGGEDDGTGNGTGDGTGDESGDGE